MIFLYTGPAIFCGAWMVLTINDYPSQVVSDLLDTAGLLTARLLTTITGASFAYEPGRI